MSDEARDPVTHTITGHRVEGMPPVVCVDGEAIPNVAESLSDWFGWGHGGLSTQALAASLAAHLNCRLDASDLLSVLKTIKTTNFTIEIGG